MKEIQEMDWAVAVVEVRIPGRSSRIALVNVDFSCLWATTINPGLARLAMVYNMR